MFVEVELGSLGEASVAEVVEVFDVVTEGVGGGDGGAVAEGDGLDAGGPCGESGAAGGGEVGGAAGAVAEDEAGDHAADAAGGVERTGVAVGAVDGQAVGGPAEDGRVPGDRRGAFGVAVSGGVVVDVIAELVAEGDGLGVVVVVAACLVSEGGVKGDAFVVIAVAVPDPVAGETVDRCGVGAVAAGVGEGVATVEDGDTVDHATGGTEAGEGFGGGDGGGARDAVGFRGVGGEVGEVLGFGGVEVPWAHEVTGEAGGADVDPVCGVGDLTDAGIGRAALSALAAAPCGGSGACGLGGGGLVDPGVLAGICGVP